MMPLACPLASLRALGRAHISESFIIRLPFWQIWDLKNKDRDQHKTIIKNKRRHNSKVQRQNILQEARFHHTSHNASQVNVYDSASANLTHPSAPSLQISVEVIHGVLVLETTGILNVLTWNHEKLKQPGDLHCVEATRLFSVTGPTELAGRHRSPLRRVSGARLGPRGDHPS